MEGAGRPAIRNRCTAASLPPAASSVHRRAWSRLDDIEPFRSDPFASARDAIRSLCPQGRVIGSATPAGFRPSRISPHLRPLPSAGIARRPQYCGPLRHPAGPACPSRGPVGACTPPTGLPVLPRPPSCRHAGATTPAGAIRCVCRLLPGPPSASPFPRWVGSRVAIFEACSAFTRVPACLLAEPPEAALWHQGASVYIVTSVNRLGCYQPKRQLLRGIRTHKENAPFHGALGIRG